MSTPTLWNNIAFPEHGSRDVSTPRVDAYFERSALVPINVQIPAHAARFIAPHTERISQLTVFIDDQPGLDEIGEYLSSPAPLIETIALCITYQRRPRDLSLPRGFFEGFLSVARTLALRGPIPSSGPCKFSKLTKFTLETCLTRSTSSTLLNILKHMPLLRVLRASLSRAERLDSVPGNPVVTLPHLKEIAIMIEDNWLQPVANQVLPSLNLPRARNVLLQLTRASAVPLAPILPLSFEERLPNFSVVPKASAALKSDSNGIVLYGSGDSRLTLCINSNTPCTFTQSTYGGLPLESVRRLRVSFRDPAVDTVFFTHLLRSMKGLEFLQLKENTIGPLGCWIGDFDQAGICPALSTLIVIDADPKVRECVEVLGQVRRHARVPISDVEIQRNRN